MSDGSGLEELLAECQRLMAEVKAERQRFLAEWAEAAAAAEAERRQLRAGMEKAAAERQSLLGEPMSDSDRPSSIPENPNLPTILNQIASQQQANAEAIGQLARIFAQFGERQSRTEAAVEALVGAVARLAESLSGLPRNGGG